MSYPFNTESLVRMGLVRSFTTVIGTVKVVKRHETVANSLRGRRTLYHCRIISVHNTRKALPVDLGRKVRCVLPLLRPPLQRAALSVANEAAQNIQHPPHVQWLLTCSLYDKARPPLLIHGSAACAQQFQEASRVMDVAPCLA